MPVAHSASDGLVVSFATPVPDRGLMDGVDPALVDWDESFTPDSENVRFSEGLWKTRAGYAAYQTLPGSGAGRLLDNLYQSSGARTRLAARGNGAAAQLYELKEGTDSVFVTATGGGSLGGTAQPMFQGVAHQDVFYFTDRAGALRKYKPANFTPQNLHVVSVSQPAAPVAAPAATPRPYFAHALDWGGGAWSDSNAGAFADTDDTSGNPPPSPQSQTRLLSIVSTAAKGETITHSTGITDLNSHALAFHVRQDKLKATVQFDFGLGSPTDYGIKLRDNQQVADEWYPVFLPIGDITSANYLRFRALTGASAVSVWVTNLILPGRLEGEYRWRYTHYDSTNGRESAPSTPSNGGQPLDFSAVGQSWVPTSVKAFSKACALRFTSDSGTDTSTDKMRVYRSGGVASLTVDENGNDLWLRVAEVPDFATTFSQQDNAGATLLHLTATTGLAIGMDLVLEPGVVGKEEYVRITGVTASTVNITLGGGANGTTQYTHANAAVIRIAFLDNVANEQIDLTTPIDVARNDPPAGAQWIARAPDGRLWLTVGSKVSVSNKPTPDRPNDFEVFPVGVDPLTTRSLTQGWSFELLGGVAADETVQWFGFFRGWPTALTRKALYVIQASSQAEWGPTSIQKLHNVGTLNGDTVQEVDGVLYWVSEGPRVMRWTGGGEEPQSVSDRLVSARLKAAPTTYWNQWFARAHSIQDGKYYKLWFTPAGQTLNTQALEYNIDRPAWEPVVRYDANGSAIGYQAAVVRAGNTDPPDLYIADSAGNVIQAETGSLDGTVPIKVRFSTWKIPLRQSHPYWQAFYQTSLVHSLLLRFAAVTDVATCTLQTGGSEYGLTTHAYAINLSGSGDKEIKVRAHRDLMGRWLQMTITGDFSNRPAFRDINIFWIPWRLGRTSH